MVKIVEFDIRNHLTQCKSDRDNQGWSSSPSEISLLALVELLSSEKSTSFGYSVTL